MEEPFANSILMSEQTSVLPKEEILRQFYRDRDLGTNLAMEGEKGWGWIDSEIRRSTNWAMGSLLIFQLIVYLFLEVYLLHSSNPAHALESLTDISIVLLVPISALLLARQAHIVCLWRFCGSFRPTDRLLLESFHKGFANEFSSARVRWFKAWKRLVFISPFTFRHLWWWVLISGIVTVELGYSSEETPTALGISLMRAVIMSVIAFIATNIIRELLHLRQGYLQAIERVELLSSSVDRLGKLIREILPTALNTLHTSLQYIDGGVHLLQLSRAAQQQPQVQTQTTGFLKGVSSQIQNYVKQVQETADLETKQWVLSTLNECISSQNEILNTSEKHIITLFSTLGKSHRQ